MFSVLAFMLGCKPSTPSQYIQPDEIVDILVDYHLSRAMAQIQPNYDEQNYCRALYWNAAMQKHGVTQEKFDSSMVYYYSHADIFSNIYKKVYDRLNDEYTLLGISEGEIGRYSALKADGDTANIWPGRVSHFMMPMPPYNRLDFSIACDTSFYEGDSFLMQFTSDFVYQSGTKDALLYVAVIYSDTTIVRHTRFYYSGLTQMRIDCPANGAPETIKGYFYLGKGHEASSTMRMLFVNNIQLIRFHKKHEEKLSVATDSLSRDSLAQRSDSAHVGGRDSIGKSAQVLPISGGTSRNRMVERIDSLKGAR